MSLLANARDRPAARENEQGFMSEHVGLGLNGGGVQKHTPVSQEVLRASRRDTAEQPGGGAGPEAPALEARQL